MEAPETLRVVYAWRGSTSFVSLHAPFLGRSVVVRPDQDEVGATLEQRLLVPRSTNLGISSVRWADGATALIAELIARLPPWQWDTDEGPMPLAVLVSGEAVGGVDLEAATDALLRTIGVSDTRYVLATDTTAKEAPPPFELPFVIGYAGVGGPAVRAAIDGIVSSYQEPVATHAFTHRRLRRSDPLWDPDIDILLTSAARLSTELSDGEADADAGPRLIVAFARTERPVRLDPATIPPGTSVLVAGRDPGATPDRFMRHLLRSLAHDRPLHAAVWSAVESVNAADRRADFHLYTAAPLLGAVRLTTALERVREQVESLRPYGGATVQDVSTAVAERLGVSRRDWDGIRDALAGVDQLRADFRRESGGLTNLAIANAQLARAADDLLRLKAAGSRLAGDATLLAALERTHDRRFAVRMRDGTASVPGGVALRAGHRYEVDAAVGVVWDHDLVPADTPAIDALLPPMDEHRPLHVTIFADGAEVLEGAVRKLDLPPVGPSNVVSFGVRIDTGARQVRLRMTVHYRGHLLQVHEIEADVDRGDGQPVRGLHASMVFTRSDALTLLDDVPERFLTIVANNDIGGATHSIQVFSSGEASHIRLTEATVAGWQADVRAQLRSAFDLFHDGKLTRARFDDTLRELAYRGRTFWRDGLLGVASAARRAQLQHLQSTASKTIQILRRQPELAIQWWLLYDWRLPTTRVERDAAVVCFGAGDGGGPCGHDTNPPGTICVRGFWGVRHVVEEFVGFGDAATRSPIAASPVAPADGPIILCAIADRKPPPERALEALRTAFGVGDAAVDIEVVKDATEMDSLVDLLSDEARRAAAVVIIGHLTVQVVDTEPDGPRVHLPTRDRFLHADSFLDDFGTWSDPHRPVIFLLACEAGADEVGKLPSFVRDLTNRGAAAVVTAETEIDVQMAIDLVTDLIPTLSGVDLGEGVRQWRQHCIGRTDPAGLLFSAFGSTGVRLPVAATVARDLETRGGDG